MSQYGSVPPPGPYVPPSQGTSGQGFQQQQQQQQQQQPTPSPYHAPASTHGVAGQAQKVGGAFGQMMNQAVTTGKPMLNKLGKTISSKLGNKPVGTPQHLQNYQSFQDHQSHQNQSQNYQQQPNQSQSYQQQPNQSFSPQPSQQWGQQQQQQQPPPPQPQQQLQPQQIQSTYITPQQSPFQQSNYASPASGHSGQSNYFPPQSSQAPNMQSQTPQQQPNTAALNANHFEQSGLSMEQYLQNQHGQGMQGQQGQGTMMPGQPQGPYQQQQEQQLHGQYPGQQTGVVGGTQGPPQHQNVQSPHMSNVSPVQPMQSQWGPPPSSQQPPVTQLHQGQPFTPVQSPPIPQEQNQQWNSMTPGSAHGQGQDLMRPQSISPSPQQQQQQQMNVPPQIPSSKPLQTNQSSTPASQHAIPQPAPTEFIAELPADMGNLSIMETKAQGGQQGQTPQYQAYHPPGGQTGSPAPGFTIPRRTVSSSSVPLADPWRFADPGTGLPTREFYILADLIFDGLDRKFEPKNTGLLEAPKILESRYNLAQDAKVFFSYQDFTAFGRMWSLEGIPHIMVPCQPWLMPNWHFSQHSHGQDVMLIAETPSATRTYATYMPALNRAGWYKFFFLEISANPDEIGELISRFCSDTYKPGVLNQPDLNKRDRAENAVHKGKACQIQKYSINRVCEETKSAMANDLDALLAQT